MNTQMQAIQHISRFIFPCIILVLTLASAWGQKTRAMYAKNGTMVLKYRCLNDINAGCSVPDTVKLIFPAETELKLRISLKAPIDTDWFVRK